ncbi:WD40-repeat-containing domain protein [Protomyces lactucae-debilis]|uniref:WD40-repeat-containing domain protein n=1 Tax=Protomyces lactucae-debilis TaxID=2754530 RepID=A0A1Y2F577_PROLT|nr:WD40-repeat-containing domain protein [Protomyces lactucae-debilis]ORY79003.1 WD40-repeat-containing domain protein [Protomyces lactucae-debilis]
MNNSHALEIPAKIGHILHPSDVPAKPVNVVRYNHSGAYFMSAGNDRKIHLWNSQNGLHVKTFEAHGYEVADVAINADSSQFASCGGDKLLFYWDVRTGVTIRRYAGHYQRLNAVCFAAEGTVLVSGSFDATVRLWDTRSQSQAPIQVLQEAKDSVSAVCAYEHTVVTGSLDGKIRTYDLRQGQLSTDVLAQPINSIELSQDGELMLVSTLDSKIRLFDRNNGGLLQQMQGHTCQRYRVPACFGYDERSVLSGSEDGHIWAWETSTGVKFKQLPCHNGKVVLGLAHHPKAAQMVSSGSDGEITMWTV